MEAMMTEVNDMDKKLAAAFDQKVSEAEAVFEEMTDIAASKYGDKLESDDDLFSFLSETAWSNVFAISQIVLTARILAAGPSFHREIQFYSSSSSLFGENLPLFISFRS